MLNDDRQVKAPLWPCPGEEERPPPASADFPSDVSPRQPRQRRPRPRPANSYASRLAVASVIIALLSLIAVAFCMTSISTLRSTVSAQSAQISQLKQYTAQTQASTLNNGQSIAGLSSQVSSMYSTLNGVVAGYPEQCSIPLTGTDGAAIFYFKCSSKK